MAALPPPLESSRQRSRAARISTMVLGVVVAGGVALLFIVVTGADRSDSTRAGAGGSALPRPPPHPPRAHVKVRIVSWANPKATRWLCRTRGHRYDDRRSTYPVLAARFLDGCGCRQPPRDRLSTGISSALQTPSGAPRRHRCTVGEQLTASRFVGISRSPLTVLQPSGGSLMSRINHPIQRRDGGGLGAVRMRPDHLDPARDRRAR